MLIGFGTGVAVGARVNVEVGSGVNVCVGVSVGETNVFVDRGVGTFAQPVRKMHKISHAIKVFLTGILLASKQLLQVVWVLVG